MAKLHESCIGCGLKSNPLKTCWLVIEQQHRRKKEYTDGEAGLTLKSRAVFGLIFGRAVTAAGNRSYSNIPDATVSRSAVLDAMMQCR